MSIAIVIGRVSYPCHKPLFKSAVIVDIRDPHPVPHPDLLDRFIFRGDKLFVTELLFCGLSAIN
ncbi:MAG: hypothetical protein II000_07475, partial [Clostridia bacterium]|nr:hypothetical protein [Clostridia bacterium]